MRSMHRSFFLIVIAAPMGMGPRQGNDIVSDPQSEDKPAETKPPEAAATDAQPSAPKAGVVKPARRPTGTPVRRAPGEAGASPRVPGAPPPDKIKSAAFMLCGLLLVGILGVGGYMLFHGRNPPPQRSFIERLSPEGKELARKVDSATELYEDGKKERPVRIWTT